MPFRPFFLAAAVYAWVPVVAWLPALLGYDIASVGGVPLPLWHARALLFGMIPAAMAGFMLTAVPRWTGRALWPGQAAPLLLALWLAGRAGVWPTAMPLALAAIVAGNIAAARDARNVGPALLVLLFAAGGWLAHATATAALGLRLGLASVVALQMILAGRVIPALTERHALLRTGVAPRLRHRAVEWPAAALAVAALAAWVAAPDAAAAQALALPAAAAAAQALRLALWQGWRVRRAPAVLALHLAYAWLPAGFLLLAAHRAWPARLGEAAAVHAWAVGGVAVLCLGIMSSMIRRHTHRAFADSAAATACYTSGLLACAARLAATLGPAWHAPALFAAILLWSASYALFLLAFGRALLFGRAAYLSVAR